MTVQARADDGLAWDGRSRNGEKWMHLTCVVGLLEFSDELESVNEER